VRTLTGIGTGGGVGICGFLGVCVTAAGWAGSERLAVWSVLFDQLEAQV